MKQNFYFVRTPLQYLNALEARNTASFHSNEHHLIVLSDFHKTLGQIQEIIESNFWTSIQFPWEEYSKTKNIPIFNGFNVLKRKNKIDTIIRSISEIDLIFWGNINTNWFFYLYHKTNSPLYILDDGFATINSIKNLNLTILITTLLSSKIGKIERFILRLNYNINWNRITFFTNFEIKNNKKKVHLHSYSYLSNHIKISCKANAVFFIGQPLIFQKMMKKEVYINLVSSILKYYQSKNLNCFYIPHRSTTLDYIPNNWSIKSFNKPLECILFDEKIEKPLIFASFYSSALYNIAMMDKKQELKIEYWQFDESDLMNFPYTTIQEVYEFVKSEARPNVSIKHKSIIYD